MRLHVSVRHVSSRDAPTRLSHVSSRDAPEVSQLKKGASLMRKRLPRGTYLRGLGKGVFLRERYSCNALVWVNMHHENTLYASIPLCTPPPCTNFPQPSPHVPIRRRPRGEPPRSPLYLEPHGSSGSRVSDPHRPRRPRREGLSMVVRWSI